MQQFAAKRSQPFLPDLELFRGSLGLELFALIDHGEAEVGEVHALVEQRMRADDDMGGVFVPSFCWGAQAASLPFAAACRELFLPCSRVPNPRIIVFRLRNPNVPGIPRYIFKF